MKKKYNKKIVIVILLGILYGFTINHAPQPKATDPPFLNNKGARWVDSVFNALTPEQRIAQLFMVSAYSNRDSLHTKKIDSLILKYNIGGLIFFQGGPVRQALLTNRYQSLAKTPLLIAIDGEWGLSMRLDSTMSFPQQMLLGASNNNALIYKMGVEIAYHCKQLGIHVNFAPVLDINNNPNNPVIGVRSFGENKYLVTSKAHEYMRGLQDNQVLAVGKHFPGHGDTDKDSHYTLPILLHSQEHLDTLEYYPFREVISQGIGGIMVAHLYVPALEAKKNIATTLSDKVVSDLLRDQLNFNGLIFTDALNMKGVSTYYKPGALEIKALQAGNDILLCPDDVPKAIAEIKTAVEKGKLAQYAIDASCRRILAVKYWVGLNKFKPIQLKGLYDRLNQPSSELIKRQLIESGLTLLKNVNSLIPFTNLDTLTVAALSIGNTANNEFHNSLSLYQSVDFFSMERMANDTDCNKMIEQLSKYNTVIVSLFHNVKNISGNITISNSVITFIRKIQNTKTTILVLFGTPYVLNKINHNNLQSILVAYDDDITIQNIAAQVLYGGAVCSGRLPVTACKEYGIGSGITLSNKIRLKYSIPEELGIRSSKLSGIDSLITRAIKNKAIPGCQLLVAKDGIVFYHKAFGHLTYDSLQPVSIHHLYDIASITKICASLPAIMKLAENKKIDINCAINDYLPYLDTTNKVSLTIKDILTHRSGLEPFIVFYKNTRTKDKQLSPTIYTKTPDSLHQLQVADSIFILTSYRDTIYKEIALSKLLKERKYVYSDLGYYYMLEIAEKLLGEKLNDYVYKNFYKPLGATTLGYNPLQRFSKTQIAPTELDMSFRKQLVWGYVHDPGAAMMGGIAGHAGLFSNANDLAKMMQMYLQKGEYGGKRFLSSAIIDTFTACPFCPENRRGLGFDKPEMDYSKIGPTCRCVSAKSYGHTGFTGCIAWADPDKQVIYIFLTNRIYPSADNKKYIDMGIRPKIQQIIYESFRE